VISSVFTEGPSNSVYIGVSTKMYLGYQASLRWLEQVREVVDARRP
jgi:triosephosphate isomerase